MGPLQAAAILTCPPETDPGRVFVSPRPVSCTRAIAVNRWPFLAIPKT
jgi:hypothetical protein